MLLTLKIYVVPHKTRKTENKRMKTKVFSISVTFYSYFEVKENTYDLNTVDNLSFLMYAMAIEVL
jgi:hypothetical protein